MLFDAVAATLPFGSVSDDALRGPSESYSDVVLKLVEAGDEGAGSKNRRLSEQISNSMMAQTIAVSTTKNRMFLMRSIALMLRRVRPLSAQPDLRERSGSRALDRLASVLTP
jgi:hypothetical protein